MIKNLNSQGRHNNPKKLLSKQQSLKIHEADGGLGRHASPPRATIERITTRSQTNNTQNCQKIEFYGSPTTKDLKKTHYPGGQEWESHGHGWTAGVVWKSGSNNSDGTDGRDTFRASDPSPRLHSPEFQHQEDRLSLPLVVKTSGGWSGERNCQIFIA